MNLDDSDDPIVGTTIGNYQVVALLGKGGMGTVYRAKHPDIGRQVAIKVVSAQFSIQPQVVSRFKAEALSVNKIGHPNIIDISDFGSLADGRPYFVMECLDGEDLGQRLLRTGLLTHEQAAPILRQTLDALAAAHAENIIHRDLKPDNIFLARRRGGLETVKLLDFGIAKLKAEVGTGATADGTLLGTPLYMSPEQAMGRMSEIGPPSDIYSMGVILYQIFTGTTPFEYQNFGELLVAHAHEPPPPPSSKKPDLDPRLEPIIMRCLAKKPGDRFPTVGALEWALTEVIPKMSTSTVQHTEQRTAQRDVSASDSGPISIRPVSAPSHPDTEVSPNGPTLGVSAMPGAPPLKPQVRKLLTLAAVAGLLLGVGGGAAVFVMNRGPAPLSATELPLPPSPGPLLEGREQ